METMQRTEAEQWSPSATTSVNVPTGMADAGCLNAKKR